MHIERSIKPVSSSDLRTHSGQFDQKGETFQDIFQRTRNLISGSRPPKIEITRILIPCSEIVGGYQFKFKLETDSDEFRLRMSDTVSSVAKKVAWEEVTVRGHLNPDGRTIEVERILVAQREPYRLTNPAVDSLVELDQYRRKIFRQGKIDLAPDFLIS